jgi:hypothetical protein
MHRSIALIVASLLSLAAPARAGWPGNPTDGNLAVCTAGDDQMQTSVVPDGAGGAVIVWQDYRSLGGYVIYAQRVSAAGVPLWTADGVAVNTFVSYQVNPVAVSDGAGGVVIAWEDFRNGNYDIYAQRLDPTGARLWAAAGVPLCAAAGNQQSPRIDTDGTGGAVVSWDDNRVLAHDVYAQRIDGTGAVQWTATGRAVCTSTRFKLSPTIAADGASGAFVVWVDSRIAPSVYQIFAQRVNATGTPQWTTNGIAMTPAKSGQSSPEIVSDGANGSIVTWNESFGGGLYDVYAQRVNSAGALQWTASGAAISTATGLQLAPHLVRDGANGAVIAWDDSRSGTSRDIYAQRVNGLGAPQWTADGVALCLSSGDQIFPRLVPDGGGGAVVTWQDMRNGTDDDIYAQRVNGAGVPLWTGDDAAVCTTTLEQSAPALASDGAGGAIIAWPDYRNGTDNNIVAQWIDSNGALGGATSGVAGAGMTQGVRLAAPSPDPAFGSTLVRFELPRAADVRLDIYDLAGRAVRRVAEGPQEAGGHSVSVALRDDAGRPLPSGVYMVRLEVAGRAFSRRLVALR